MARSNNSHVDSGLSTSRRINQLGAPRRPTTYSIIETPSSLRKTSLLRSASVAPSISLSVPKQSARTLSRNSRIPTTRRHASSARCFSSQPRPTPARLTWLTLVVCICMLALFSVPVAAIRPHTRAYVVRHRKPSSVAMLVGESGAAQRVVASPVPASARAMPRAPRATVAAQRVQSPEVAEDHDWMQHLASLGAGAGRKTEL